MEGMEASGGRIHLQQHLKPTPELIDTKLVKILTIYKTSKSGHEI
jgi:hypothetical protein